MKTNFFEQQILLVKGSIIIIIALFNIVVFAQEEKNNLIFENGFENGTVDWDGNQGHCVKSTPTSVMEVSTTAREGNKAVLFKSDPDGIRSELQPGNGDGDFPWGEEFWVGFSFLIREHITGYGVISQHHSVPGIDNDGNVDWDNCIAGANSFTIRAVEGNLEIFSSTNTTKTLEVPASPHADFNNVVIKKPYKLNQWYDFVLHFRYATDTTGFIEVWMDGEKIIDIHNSPNVYLYDCCGREKTHNQYQKFGMYQGSKKGGEIIYDAFRIGNANASYEEVAPRD